jgi:hypothetical protein
VLCEACWGVNVWIGAPQLLEGPLVEYCLCGIGRFWRRSKSVWGVYCFLLLQNFEDGFSWAFAGFMGLIPTLIEDTYGRSWLACLIGGIYCGALGETSTSPVFLVKD